MKFNRNFTVQSDEATTRSYLVAAMNRMRYRLVTSEPLRFERGSFWGRWLSNSPIEWKCDAAIELKQSSVGDIAVHIVLNISQLPTFIFAGWSLETQSILDFWMRELDLIESAAGGNVTGLETNLNFGITKATREYYGAIAIMAIVWIGAVGIALVLWNLGTLSYDLMILLVLLALLPIPLIPMLLFQLRRKNTVP